jgi:hypothetical protein
MDSYIDKNLQYINDYLNRIEPYYIALIISIGFIGNTVSLLLFLSTKLKYFVTLNLSL